MGECVVARGGGRLVFGDVERVAREERGVFDAGRLPGADGAIVKGGGLVVADNELAEDRLVDGAEDGLAVMKERDQGGEERHAGDERFGAVDGIEDPDEFGVGVFVAEFFADDAVGREFFGDPTAEELLGAAVGERDGRGVGFGFDGEGRVAEVRTNEVTAFVGELRKEGAVGREIHGERDVRDGRRRHEKIAREKQVSISGAGWVW